MPDNILELKNITKKFDDKMILNNCSIDIKRGEFLTLLGKSGCGKTTTLRIIAGLEQLDSGSVILNGRDITYLEPNKRELNTIFQSYALFPHMNVYDNVAYGLKIRGVSKSTIKDAVTNVLEAVQLIGFEKKRIDTLSGGEKQRVAIARAIINKPSLLLLDEPLSALDLQLRKNMQNQLKNLQKKLDLTFIYITHDQEEAINMSDRIAVMKEGSFVQIGSPDEIYNAPRTSYVATFVGNANIINAKVINIIDSTHILVDIAGKNVSISHNLSSTIQKGQSIKLAVRCENVVLNCKEENATKAKVIDKFFGGGLLSTTLQLSNNDIITSTRYGLKYDAAVGSEICISFMPDSFILLEA